MNDYQAIYDAVRSRIHGGNVSDAIENVIREANIGHYAEQAFQAIATDMVAPHVLMRPALSIDGNQWCALYGEDLQDGVAGFGDSPADAMRDFDRNWFAKLPSSREKNEARPDTR